MEELTLSLEKLAEQLGTTVEYLWPKLVAYSRVKSAFMSCIIIVLVTVGFILAVRLGRKTVWDLKKDPDNYNMVTMLVLIVTILLLFGLACELAIVLFPEQQALKAILQSMR